MGIDSQTTLFRNPGGRLLLPYDVIQEAEARNICQEDEDRVNEEYEQLSRNLQGNSFWQELAGRGEATVDPSMEDAHEEVPTEAAKPSRRVRIFSEETINQLKVSAKSATSEVKRRVEAAIKTVGDGYRIVPDLAGVTESLDVMYSYYANFGEVLDHLQEEVALAGAMEPESFRIAPVLLDGPAGVGKTAFAQEFARILDIPFVKISAGGMQHAAQLTGTATHWSNAQTGEVFSMIAGGEWASGVLLIDEVDKVSDRLDYAILPALLDLLEQESARNYVDESVRMRFDASKLIVLLTSNDTQNMHEALLSRCNLFQIANPTPAQRVTIGLQVHKKINESLVEEMRTKLDMQVLEALAASDIDLRILISAIRKGCSVAIRNRSGTCIPMVANSEMTKKRQIGFSPS